MTQEPSTRMPVFGFHGFHANARELARELEQQNRGSIFGITGATPPELDLARSSGLQHVGEHWDTLLANRVNVIVVCGSRSELCDEARQAASAGIDLVVFPDARQGETWAYEISLVSEEQRSRAIPIWLHRHDPVLQTIQQHDTKPQQVEFEVAVASTTNTMQRDDWSQSLLPLLDQIRWLFGPYDRIMALPSGPSGDQLFGLNLVLSASNRPDITMTIKPASSASVRMVLVEGENRMEYTTSAGQSWRRGGEPESLRNDVRMASCCQMLASVLKAPRRNDWSTVVQAFEMLDGIHRSIQRRRTIELHFERISERAQFKTQMATMGCFLLLAFPVLVLAYLGIASLIPLSEAALNVLRFAIFAPLFLFLAAQALYAFTRDDSSNDRLPS